MDVTKRPIGRNCSSNWQVQPVAKLYAIQRPSCAVRRTSCLVARHRSDSAPAASTQQAATDRAEAPPKGTAPVPVLIVQQHQPATAQPDTTQPVQQPQHEQSKAEPQQQQQQQEVQLAAAPHARPYSGDTDAVDGNIKIIGLGQRGISATTRLMGNKSMQAAEFWVLDTDSKVLSSCGAPNTMRIPVEDDAQLSPAELTRLAGEAAVAAAAAAPGQRPGSPVATCGVAFIVAGAGGIPGGSTLLLQVANYMRRTGYFVVAALTRPFEFEGRRKLEEADALIEALQDVAQLVVVVPQGVLTRASAELTINEASAIADNTLEVSCRAILWALGAPEMLRASAGSMLWHGRDLRQYKRLLSPPLEVLLTCPGVGGLGRGLASLPVASLAEAGLASGLSTLAEDAVAAAVESPFLESVMPRASGALCVLSLPARVLSHDFSMDGALNDPEKYAIRAAVQVAAMTVVDLAGKHCEEVVVCAHVRPDWPHTDPKLLCLEATLLVLEDPAAAEEAASGPVDNKSYPFVTPPWPATPSARAGPSGPILHSMQVKPQQQQQGQGQQKAAPLGAALSPGRQAAAAAGQPQQGQAQAAAAAASPSASSRSAWSAMSAIAGGSAAAAVGQFNKQGRPSRAGTQLSIGQPGIGASSNRKISPGRPTAGAPSTSSSGGGGADRPKFNFLGNAPSNMGAANSVNSRAGSGLPGDRMVPASQQPPQQQQQQQQPVVNAEVTFVPRMADKHVDTMVAQSLDLPPSAARWRHQQRRQQPRHSHFPLPVVPWHSGPAASPAAAGSKGSAPAGVEGFVGGSKDLDEEELDPPRDVKSRVAGMLQQERREGWLYDQQD